jgi:hypothetical protein
MTAKPTSATETDRWKIDRDPSDPNAKWVPKVPGGGYRVTKRGAPPESVPPELYEWVKDMGEWNKMMREAVVDLRRRVEELEKKCK